ncbi:MAG: amidohydrolase family protein, partial [Gemmatimonadota bacterium]
MMVTGSPVLAGCLTAALLALPSFAEAQSVVRQPAVALTGVTVVDGTGAAPREGMTILIEEGQIRDVFPTGTGSIPDSMEVRELTGRFVIPGL